MHFHSRAVHLHFFTVREMNILLHRRFVVLLICASSAFLELSATRAAEPVSNDRGPRLEFAAALDKLEVGMHADDALRLVGQPDDIRTHSDPPGFSTAHTEEIWCYGTSGHMTTATLGQVYFDDRGIVQYIFGQGESTACDSMSEVELRSLLTAIDRVPGIRAYSFNPRLVIQAVNFLQPLGKEMALDVIAEYLRVTPPPVLGGHDGVLVILRALFEVPNPPGYMPILQADDPFLSSSADRELLPRYPLVVKSGIPMLLTTGNLFSAPQSGTSRSHVRLFRKQSKLHIRTAPLVPSDHPFRILEEFTESAAFQALWNNRTSAVDTVSMLRNQILWLVDTVYRLEPVESGALI